MRKPVPDDGRFMKDEGTEPFPYLRCFPEGSLFLDCLLLFFRCGRRESDRFRSWKEARRRVRTGRFRVFRLCKNGLRAGRRVELVRTVPRRGVCCGLKIQNRLYGFFPVLSFSPAFGKARLRIFRSCVFWKITLILRRSAFWKRREVLAPGMSGTLSFTLRLKPYLIEP